MESEGGKYGKAGVCVDELFHKNHNLVATCLYSILVCLYGCKSLLSESILTELVLCVLLCAARRKREVSRASQIISTVTASELTQEACDYYPK
jgi:hypothetical protein